MKKTTSLTFGLFTISPRHPYYWMKNFFKDIFILCKRIPFLLEHGYNEPALWESFAYFINQWEEILHIYRYKRNGTPVIIDIKDFQGDDWEKENEQAYNDKLDKMIANLEIMKNGTSLDLEGDWNRVIAAKDEFFNDFSKCFFHFWD